MVLNWGKCAGDVWCQLNAVNLDHPIFRGLEGVYVIWHGGENAAVVYVGQGAIRDRLMEHRADTEIQRFASLGLYVTWAVVDAYDRDGVERYLADTWNPKVGKRHPNVNPTPVNAPW